MCSDLNLIIECNGLYWHSDKFRDSKYHVEKLNAYELLGYRALFFTGAEIKYKTQQVFSVILNAISLNTRKIGARKAVISYCSPDFFAANHLMGKGSGKCYGLWVDNDCIAGLQFKCVNKADRLYEVSRFCTAPYTTVPGGFSKLLNHAIRDVNALSVQTFIDRRYGRGHYLTQLDFVKKTENVSFSWTDFNTTFHRMKFPGNSGYASGLSKLWDCGQAKYVLTVR